MGMSDCVIAPKSRALARLVATLKSRPSTQERGSLVPPAAGLAGSGQAAERSQLLKSASGKNKMLSKFCGDR